MQTDPDGVNALTQEDKARLEQTGLEVGMEHRTGSFFQKDQEVIHCTSVAEGLEVIPIAEAMEKHPWIEDYLWNAVPADKDKYTSYVASQEEPRGVVIIAHEGSKPIYPLQACLYLVDEPVQHVHNIVIARDGAELHLISGCASATHEQQGAHYGVTEFYVGKGAKITSTMIHNWGAKINVFPRSAAIVEENGVFISNYVCMHPVRKVQMYPTASLVGDHAVAQFSSIVVATPGSCLDLGSRAVLLGKHTSAELITRAITTGGTIISRGHVIGATEETRGHIECRGLVLSDGIIHAIPELEARVAGTELSHEAAVGRIARDEIEYLMARGLDEETATSTIIRGFLDVKIKGLPELLQRQIDAAIDAAESGF